MTPLPVVTLDGRSLTPGELLQIVRGRVEARIDGAARERNASALRLVRELLARGDCSTASAPASGRCARPRRRWRTPATTSGGWCAVTRVGAVRR